MGRNSGSKELTAFLKRMEELEKDAPKMLAELAEKESKVVEGMVKERTPEKSGLLRVSFHGRAEPSHGGKGTDIIIENNVEYASHVERGHRLVNKSGKTIGYVQGRYMMRTGVRLYKDKVMRGRISRFVEKKIQEQLED